MTETEWLGSCDPVAMLDAVGETNGDHPDRTFYGQAPRRISERQRRLFTVAWWRMFQPHSKSHETHAHYVEKSGNRQQVDDFLAECNWYLDRGGEDAAQYRTLAPRACAALRCIVGNPYRPVTLPKGEPVKCRRCEGDGWNPSDDGWGARDKCKVCDGKGTLNLFGPCPWLTPTVVSLARAAEEHREQKCGTCEGDGYELFRNKGPKCPDCHGTGKVSDTLDPDRLAILADALEESGCTEGWCEHCARTGRRSTTGETCWVCAGTGRVASPVVVHLRGPGVHVPGCWVLDLLLSRE